MTNYEIKKKIDENNNLIQMLFEPNRFTLNNKVRDLLKENEELQKQCTHSFVGGYCEYCYMEEPKE